MLPKKTLQYHIAYPFTVLVLLTVFLATTIHQQPVKEVLDAHTTAASLPVATVTPIIAADMMILVSVKFSGIGLDGNKKPKHLTRKVTAYVYDTSQEVATGAGLLTYDGKNLFKGIIHLGKVSQGSYMIKLISDNAIQALVKPNFQTLYPNKVNSVPPITFYEGDNNNDKVLTNADIHAELSCLEKTNTCSTDSDLNDDGRTNIADYNLLLESFTVMKSI